MKTVRNLSLVLLLSAPSLFAVSYRIDGQTVVVEDGATSVTVGQTTYNIGDNGVIEISPAQTAVEAKPAVIDPVTNVETEAAVAAVAAKPAVTVKPLGRVKLFGYTAKDKTAAGCAKTKATLWTNRNKKSRTAIVALPVLAIAYAVYSKFFAAQSEEASEETN